MSNVCIQVRFPSCTEVSYTCQMNWLLAADVHTNLGTAVSTSYIIIIDFITTYHLLIDYPENRHIFCDIFP